MEYKDSEDSPSSFFSNIKQISEFENHNNLIKSSSDYFFNSNLQVIIKSSDKLNISDQKLFNSLQQFILAFEANTNLFEDLILKSNLISSLIQILINIDNEIKYQYEKNGSDFCPNQLQLSSIESAIFKVFQILSHASNSIVRMILADNSLFDNLFKIINTMKYSQQAIEFLQLFHCYFQRFDSISYTYAFPENGLKLIFPIVSQDNIFNGGKVDSEIILFFEDIIKHSELSDASIMDIIYITIICLGHFENIKRFKNACNFMKFFFHKNEKALFFFVDDSWKIIDLFSARMKKLSTKDSDASLECIICSVIDEAFKCLTDNSIQNDIMSHFEPNLLYKILRKKDAKHINVDSIINLISNHFELGNLTLETFISDGGHALIIDLLNDSSYATRLSILKLLLKLSDMFGWPLMPDNSFSSFMENCFDILTNEDAEIGNIFYKGFFNALKVNDKAFNKKVMNVYSNIDGMEELMNDLLNHGSAEVRTLINEILAIINADKEIM